MHLMSRSRGCVISTSASFGLVGTASFGSARPLTSPATSCIAYWRIGCVSAWNKGSDSHLMIFAGELAVLQRENQRHEDRHPDFFACAEWFGS